MRRLLTAVILTLIGAEVAAQVPAACHQYRTLITRSAYRTFGPSAPVATLAAQIHQESACNASAKSWVGAAGAAQFMPATAEDMAKRHPDICAPANPLNPQWAIGCRDRYMKEILGQFKSAETESDQWGFALSGYNGGSGWVRRDQVECAKTKAPPCNRNRWWGNVEFTPDIRRAKWAIKENRGYPSRIMCVIAPRYVAEGWGRGVECPK